MPNLPAHHLAWLKNHPERDEAWLRERTADGFDIHHIDGDHSNNDPDNLVLIEHLDHMRIHGFPLVREARAATEARQAAVRARRLEQGKACYAERRDGRTWIDVGRRVFGRAVQNQPVVLAKFYAGEMGLPWPIKKVKQHQ